MLLVGPHCLLPIGDIFFSKYAPFLKKVLAPRGVLFQESPAEPVNGTGGSTATLAAPARSLRVLDLDRRELALVSPLVALIIVLGVYPQPLIDLIEPAVAATMSDLGASSGGTD